MREFLAARSHAIDTSEIRRVFDLAAKIPNPLNLSIGQPDFPVPQPVKEAIAKAIVDNKTGYTQTAGLPALREAIVEFLAEKTGFRYHPDHTIVSTGVASILFLLFQALIEKDDAVLLLDPYFLIYPALVRYHGARQFTIPEDFGEAEIATLEAELAQKGIKLKLIIYASPSNPTGKILNRLQLALLAELAEKHDAVIAADEIYAAFDYENQHVSMASLAPARTLTLNGFSKSHALTGLRVGYLAAPPRFAEIVQKMITLQQYTMVCAPQPAQWGAITALKTPIHEELKTMKRRRDFVIDKLRMVTTLASPDGAFYVYPKVPVDSAQFVAKAIERRLLLVPGYIFSANRNYVRISYATREDILEEGCAVFCGLVEELTTGVSNETI
ncbi:MAG: aminotransferase class I/II-fold pyridoxal phosphate-dependent enzyme [Turneriella sp.]|nr:aminotransferase class I/II-fold pyridoxal phosphate-dependent enzyme [Leptospiraceae bacterium]MCX7632436.1 aminotransferase class I/II-fold pyridoxal phosphate-dependent enzyme [Turneriella sp.]